MTYEKIPAIADPAAFRRLCREGGFAGPSSGHAPGFVQANMVVLPEAEAGPFAEYCARNPGPCPILEILPPGAFEPVETAPDADVRTDLPRYRVFRQGALDAEPTDIRDIWHDDLVTFLLGCSFIAEDALHKAGLTIRHIAETGYVSMYRTDLPTLPVGAYHGPLVVSMRPFAPVDAERAAAVTRRYPMAHGAPIHRGDPAEIGIRDIAAPEYGRPVTIEPGKIPVFWACGVTPQEAILNARPELAITHMPGCMFVGDRTADSTRI